jgi:hypothetical protein
MAQNINATDVVVKIDGVIVGCARSAEFTVSREMDEATCAASGGWKQVSGGQLSWTGSFTAYLRDLTDADGANMSFEDAFDLVVEGTEVTVEYARKIAGTAKRYSGKALVTEVKYTQPEKGTVEWSANYTGNGALVKI